MQNHYGNIVQNIILFLGTYFLTSNPVDAKRKLNVHKAFIKCLVRLRNVLPVFNLHLVSKSV